MNLLKTLLGGGNLIGEVRKTIDDLNLSGEEKQEFQLQMETLLQKRDSEIEQTARAETQARERVLVAELTQGDNFTKRARPSVVYIGLIFIALNHVIGPWAAYFIGTEIPEITLPTEFWVAWGGIVATWSIGRTMEKRGQHNKMTGAITGTTQPPRYD